MRRNDGSPWGLVPPEDTVLVIIDVQEKLMAVMSDKDKVLANVARLAAFSQIMGIPVIVTEQENLGSTLPEVRSILPHIHPIPKIHFDCFHAPEFASLVDVLGRGTLVLTGAEAHICVAQTAIHGLERFSVHVVADAVASRAPENCRLSLDRLRQAGAVVTSTEMFMYELLKRAGTDEFKRVLQLVK
jgi:nicotinamidase-related amidase